VKRDSYGRRLFKSEEQALKAQQSQVLAFGVFSGVRYSPKGYYLLWDTNSDLYESEEE
jgi:hypothetical protein